MTRYFVCTNPYSGSGKSKRSLQQVKSLFNQQNIQADYVETQHAGHGKQIFQQLDFTSYTGMVVIGGDGSIHDAINGILTNANANPPPLGFIAGGSGNSLMHDLQCLSVEQAVNAILQGNTASMDILALQLDNQRLYSFNITGWGLISDIGIRSEKMRWLGASRYTLATLIELARLKFRRAQITVDGVSSYDVFTLISLCNTKHTGKAMCLAPKAELSDGLVDCLIIRQASRFTLLKFFPKVFNGTHVKAPVLDYQHIKTMQLKPQQPMTLLVDGEVVSEINQLDVTVLPEKLTYFSHS